MQTILADLRFALRQLRRSPAFAVTAILTLALGVGANTAVFSLLDQALLRSLPVRAPQQLIVLKANTLTWNGSSSNNGGDDNDYFSYPMYQNLQEKNQVFDGLIGTAPAEAGFSRGSTSQVLDIELVTGNYFNILGVIPALGRLFSPDDNTASAPPAAVVSFDFWRNTLSSDPKIIGQTVNLNSHPFVVIGVAAPRFHSAVWGQTPQVFVPIEKVDLVTSHDGAGLRDHFSRWMIILGRLKPGMTAAHAQVGIAPLWHALRSNELKALGTRSPKFVAGFVTNSRLLVNSGAQGFSYRRPTIEKPFLALMAMAILVLLIASVNVASLLLVRSASRVREFALRSALGARRGRVVVQLLLEGLLIGVAGAAIGLALAPLALRVLVNHLTDPDSGTPFSAAIDLRLLAFNFSIALLVSLVFSLAPALQLRKLNITSTLRESTGTGSGGLLNLRRLVVCLQIGLSVILLVASGLFLRTMQKLRAVDAGFNTSNLVTFDLDPTLAGLPADSMPAFHQRILTSLAAIPAVQSVAATNDPELAGNHSTGNISVFGYQAQPGDDTVRVEQSTVTSNYFSVLQMPIVAGRSLDEHDTLDHPLVAVVNQTFAKHFCGTPAACIGRMMANGAGDHIKLDTQIVGVVRDARHGSLRETTWPAWFRPLLQQPKSDDLNFYLRYYGDSAPVIASVRRVLQEAGTGLAPTGLRTMEEQIDNSLSNESLIALLSVAFGLLATLLAGVGIYGVLAYTTAQRTREIGIRIALGSSRAGVARIVLSDVLRLAGLGIAVALPVAFGLSTLIGSQLFGVTSADPVTLTCAVTLIAVVALIAALIPANRAASVNPTVALRTE
jgi:putative ABC transport system permease protein